MKKIFKVALFVLFAIVAFFVTLILAISALGIFGVGIAIISATLVFYSPGFRAWLSGQRGYDKRLSKLPGLGSMSAVKQSIAILVYLLPPSIISWFLLPFENVSSAVTSAVFGLVGLTVFYGWFIYGWRLKKEEAPAIPTFSFSESVAFFKGNKVAIAALTLALAMPVICAGTGISIFNERGAATNQPLAEVENRSMPSNNQLADEIESTLVADEVIVSETPILQETNTPIPTETPKPTLTSTALPTNTSRPTATITNTPMPQLKITSSSVNLRGGPGVNYQSIGVLENSEIVTVLARNSNGSWYNVQLSNGTTGWIAASVSEPIDGMVINQIALAVTIPPEPQPTNTPRPTSLPPTSTSPAPTISPPTATDPPVPTEAPSVPGDVKIAYIFFDGVVSRVESDEYAVITNQGGSVVNIGGWRLNAGAPGQDFGFPSFDLQPGQSCRVYTNESHPEYCGFSFGKNEALWNNGGDCGHLFDASGVEVSTYCY